MKKYSLVILAALVVVAGSLRYLSSLARVTANVSGRELPIYSVETEEKKVALSFDAAWGNEDTQKILDILKKDNAAWSDAKRIAIVNLDDV